MKIAIKDFDVKMEIKNNGIEFQVYDTNDNFLGDCFLTKTGLVWCKGKTSRKKGKKISWEEFIDDMEKR
jgi:hypothetical protein